tara:strand:- start:1983 stop:2978 length:996 start_codon:yes stop_codon:yes gene_type:complete
MLNILSLLGPSRSGKGAIIPIIVAAKNFQLPFNTPDLDWYVDAFNFGDIDSDSLCRLSANYLLCYSWYGYLGRHINLRPDDYYSFQKLMPHQDLNEKHSRYDKDDEFLNFINDNDQKKIWNIFQWDLAPQIYEIFEEKYPIKTNPLYCYRSPYYLFTSWISSNRVKRSISLSRMFKYDATKYFKRESLLSQFEGAKNDNEQEYIKELGTTEWDKFNLKESKTYKKEEERLINLIEENNNNAAYWSKRNMMFNFEHVVSKPESFVDYLMSRFDIEFDEDLLKKGIVIMDKRPLENVVELDFIKIESTLKELGCSDKTMNYVINQQKRYLDNL